MAIKYSKYEIRKSATHAMHIADIAAWMEKLNFLNNFIESKKVERGWANCALNKFSHTKTVPCPR